MIIFEYPQRSLEWWDLKCGRISGTRFSKVISNKKNRLLYELMNEILDGHFPQEEFVSEEMQYGIDNEDTALELYSAKTGIKVNRVGAIISESNDIHIASPDGVSESNEIVQEVKCTMNGYIHIQRFFEGVESSNLPQCINYFAVAPEVMEVHYISYCGERPEKPMIYTVLKREDYQKQIDIGLKRIDVIKAELATALDTYRF